jgi:dihydrofolate reductase
LRRIVVTEFVTIDGNFKLAELRSSDALLLGRITYEGFAAAWPAMKDSEGFADRMNEHPKHVVSSTLKTLAWRNSSLLEGDLGVAVAELKARPGRDIFVTGSTRLAQELAHLDLVDEWRLLVYPVVLGTGRRLFRDNTAAVPLSLVESRAFPKGVVLLRIERNDQPERAVIPFDRHG